MTLRWFGSITAAAALALAGFAVTPDIPSAVAASKARHDNGATAGKTKPPIPMEVVGPIDTQARSALIMEVETGTVLLNKNADERIPPASMSKLMTAYLVFDYLKQGRATLDDELPVSEKAWRTGGSKMFVPLGARVKISDLIRGMIVQSGNDACVVLAEGLAGSEAAFVEQMNQKAKEIGLTNSHFAN